MLNELCFVDTREREHHRGTNHVLLGLLNGWRTGPVRNIGIARRVNDTLRKDGFPASLTLDNGTCYSTAIHHGGDE